MLLKRRKSIKTQASEDRAASFVLTRIGLFNLPSTNVHLWQSLPASDVERYVCSSNCLRWSYFDELTKTIYGTTGRRWKVSKFYVSLFQTFSLNNYNLFQYFSLLKPVLWDLGWLNLQISIFHVETKPALAYRHIGIRQTIVAIDLLIRFESAAVLPSSQCIKVPRGILKSLVWPQGFMAAISFWLDWGWEERKICWGVISTGCQRNLTLLQKQKQPQCWPGPPTSELLGPESCVAAVGDDFGGTIFPFLI